MITNLPNYINYSPNGTSTVFAIPFSFADISHVHVYLTTGGVEVELTADFTVAKLLNGGTVTFVTAPAAGTTLRIQRSTTPEQSVDYVNNDLFDANIHESQMDRMVLAIQDVKAKADSAVQDPTAAIAAMYRTENLGPPLNTSTLANGRINVVSSGTVYIDGTLHTFNDALYHYNFDITGAAVWSLNPYYDARTVFTCDHKLYWANGYWHFTKPPLIPYYGSGPGIWRALGDKLVDPTTLTFAPYRNCTGNITLTAVAGYGHTGTVAVALNQICLVGPYNAGNYRQFACVGIAPYLWIEQGTNFASVELTQADILSAIDDTKEAREEIGVPEFGSGVPLNTNGKDGGYYVDFVTGLMYKKVVGVWTVHSISSVREALAVYSRIEVKKYFENLNPFVLGETFSETPGTLCTVPLPSGVTAPYHQIHPSIVYFPTGKDGYKYWMGCCPYHGAGVLHENPCVYVSNDGVTFVDPPGLTNPISPTPVEGGNNADPQLYWDELGQQFVMSWMRGALGYQWNGTDYSTAPGYNSGEIKMKTSPDGIVWSDLIHAIQDNCAVVYASSPSLMRMPDGTWRLYIVNQAPNPNTIEYYTATSLTGPWTASGVVATYSTLITQPWHVEIQRYGSDYIMLLNTVDNYSRHQLLFLTSTDGVAWVVDANYPFAQAWFDGAPSYGYYKSACVLGPWFGPDVIGRLWSTDELWQFIKVSDIKRPGSRLASNYLDNAINQAVTDTANTTIYKIGTTFPYANGNLNALTTDGKAWYGYGANVMQVDTNAIKMGAGASYACLPAGIVDGVVGMRISKFPIDANFNIEVRSNRAVGLQRLQVEFQLKVWAVKVYTGSAWVNLAGWYPPLLGVDFNMDGTVLIVEFRGYNVKVYQNYRKMVDLNMDQATYDYIKAYTNTCITIVDANTRIDRFFAHSF
jgi:hypothetical protein